MISLIRLDYSRADATALNTSTLSTNLHAHTAVTAKNTQTLYLTHSYHGGSSTQICWDMNTVLTVVYEL